MQPFLKGYFSCGEKYLTNLKPRSLKNQETNTSYNIVQRIQHLFAMMPALRNYLRFSKKSASISKSLKNPSDRWLPGFQPWTINLSLPPHSSVSLRNLLERWLWFPGKLPAFNYL